MVMRIACALFLLWSAAAPAQDCTDFRVLPDVVLGPYDLGERPAAIAASDSVLCWSVDSTLVLCRVSADEPNLSDATRYPVAGEIAALRLDHDRLAVATATGSWLVLDVAAPAEPVLLGASPGDVGCLDVDVRGNWVFAAEQSGLAVYELQPDGTPIERHRASIQPTDACLSTRVRSVDADGDRCWALVGCTRDTDSRTWLLVMDATDPAAPVVIGEQVIGTSSMSDSRSFAALQVDGGRAVLSGLESHYGMYPGDSWSSSFAIVYVESADGGFREDFIRWNQDAMRASVCGDRLSVLTPTEISSYVHDGESWREADGFGTGGGWVAASPAGAWILQEEAAWRVLTPPADWPQVGIFHLPAEYSGTLGLIPGRLMVEEWYGYDTISPMSEITVFDTADPRHPVRMGAVAGALAWSGQLYWRAHGDYIYTSRGIWDCRTLEKVSSWGGAVLGAVGDALWTGGNQGVVIHDLADPLAPSPVGVFLVGEYVSQVVTSGNRAVFVANGKFIVADVTQPLAPVRLHDIPRPPVSVYDVALDGDRFIVSHANGLTIYRLAGGEPPTVVGQLADLVPGVVVTDQSLVYARISGGLAVIDLTSEAAPTVLGTFPTGGAIADLVVAGDYLYMNDGRLSTLKKQCEIALGVEVLSFTLSWRGAIPCISWSLRGGIGDVRLVAYVAGIPHVVPWRFENGKFEAVDEQAPRGQMVQYELQCRVDGQWATLATESVLVPRAGTRLLDPRPNPFNPGTEIRFSLESAGDVLLTVHDLAGRRLRTLVSTVLDAGEHAATWDGRDDGGRAAASGTYFARLSTTKSVQQVKVMLVR